MGLVGSASFSFSEVERAMRATLGCECDIYHHISIRTSEVIEVGRNLRAPSRNCIATVVSSLVTAQPSPNTGMHCRLCPLTAASNMAGHCTKHVRRLAELDTPLSLHPLRYAYTASIRRRWSTASMPSFHTNAGPSCHCSRSSAVYRRRRTILAPPNQSSPVRILRRSFANSALQQMTANVLNNKPLQLWIVGGAAVAIAYAAYNEYFAENKDEAKVWNKALAAISQSTLPQSLHAVEGGRVRLLKGKRLSGYTEMTESDVWHEVRMVEDVTKEQQEKKESTADASNDGRVLGLYKVRVTARRERPVLPSGLSINITKRDKAVDTVELDKAIPEWQLQSIVVSSSDRQCSYYVDPATKAVRRADEFIPPTALLAKAPAASTSTATDSDSTPSNASTSSWLTWSNAFFGVCGVGGTSLAGVYLLRYWSRQQLLTRVKSAVQSSLSVGPMPVGGNVRVARVVSSKIGDAMLRAEVDVLGDKAGSAGSGRVRLQAIRSSRGGQAGQMSDWQIVHSQLTTNDGRTQQLSLPNIKS